MPETRESSQELAKSKDQPRVFVANTSLSDILQGKHEKDQLLAIIRPYLSDYLPLLHQEGSLDEFYDLCTRFARKNSKDIKWFDEELNRIMHITIEEKSRVILNFLNLNPDLKEFLIAHYSKIRGNRQPRIFLTFNRANANFIYFDLKLHDINQIQVPISNTSIVVQYSTEPDQSWVLTQLYPHLLEYDLRGGKHIMLALMSFFVKDKSPVDAFRINQPTMTALGMYHSLGFMQNNLYKLTKTQAANMLKMYKDLSLI